MTNVNRILTDLLEIPSPTGSESAINDWCDQFIKDRLVPDDYVRTADGIIAQFGTSDALPTIALVGHVDVVPEHFDPIQTDTVLHGAGASDMKGGVAAFLACLSDHKSSILTHYNLQLIIYNREEGTPLPENGLYGLFQSHANILRQIDAAIIGEPTKNAIQVGCMGSYHGELTILGQSAHSARPWEGTNAIYKATGIMDYFRQLQMPTDEIYDCSFRNVMTITSSQSEPGRTSVPGYWTGTINYRFSPRYSEQEATDIFKDHINLAVQSAGLVDTDWRFVLQDSVPAGQVIPSDVMDTVIQQIDQPIQAKQAWTDVAQFGLHQIPAINFGPGDPAQAHQQNEYIYLKDLNDYLHLLNQCLTGGSL